MPSNHPAFHPCQRQLKIPYPEILVQIPKFVECVNKYSECRIELTYAGLEILDFNGMTIKKPFVSENM